MQENTEHKPNPSHQMLQVLQEIMQKIDFLKPIQIFTKDLQNIEVQDIQQIQQSSQIIENVPKDSISKFSITEFMNTCAQIEFIHTFTLLKNRLIDVDLSEKAENQIIQPVQEEDIEQNQFITKQVEQYANKIEINISNQDIQEKLGQQNIKPFYNEKESLFDTLALQANKFLKMLSQNQQKLQNTRQIVSDVGKVEEVVPQSNISQIEDHIPKSIAVKEGLEQVIDKQTKEYIEAKLKQKELKQSFMMRVVDLLKRRQLEAVRITFDAFKIGKSQHSIEEKQQRFKVQSSSSKRKSQQSEDFQMDLTIKTKHSKNLFNYSKQQSLMYSNSSSFAAELSPQKKKEEQSVKNIQKHSSSLKSGLEKIVEVNFNEEPAILASLNKSQSNKIFNSIPFEEEDQNHEKNKSREQIDSETKKQAKQQTGYRKKERDQKRENRKRVETEIDKPRTLIRSRNSHQKFSKVNNSRVSIDSSNSKIFSTQINQYQSKIVKIRETKELRKKRLEEQLQKINLEIQSLKKKQEMANEEHNDQSIASKLQIDNNQALVRAQSFVRNLRSDKKNRALAKLGQFKNLDHNINQYMEQLSKMRVQNQNKLKQRKKLEILERMKQKQMEKAKERLKKEETIKFVLHLQNIHQVHDPIKKSPKKRTEVIIQEAPTPQLSSKKAYLNKIRNFSIKKSKPDIYEQSLS